MSVIIVNELRFNEPLARYNSWHVGGSAECFFQPQSTDRLIEYIRTNPAKPFTWLGLGSNVLVADQGIAGTVISTQKCLNQITLLAPNQCRVEAGVACAKLAKFAASYGLGDMAFMAGIPGSIGGALVMNAGCYGQETWDNAIAVEILDNQGIIQRINKDQLNIGYRQVTGLGDVCVIAGIFQLAPLAKEQGLQKIKDLLSQRGQSQPIGQFSGGSVFQNPQGDYAGRLIEACGLKGACEGDAVISDKHANFIINKGQASAEDIMALIIRAGRAVKKQFGIRLQPEVRLLGFAGGFDELW